MTYGDQERGAEGQFRCPRCEGLFSVTEGVGVGSSNTGHCFPCAEAFADAAEARAADLLRGAREVLRAIAWDQVAEADGLDLGPIDDLLDKIARVLSAEPESRQYGWGIVDADRRPRWDAVLFPKMQAEAHARSADVWCPDGAPHRVVRLVWVEVDDE